MDAIPVEYPTDWTEYELIDSGDGMKLERFGAYTVARPDPRALWSRTSDLWNIANAAYVRTNATEGAWEIRQSPPSPWIISYKKLKFILKPTSFKHVGIFPEQAVNWQWIERQIHGDDIKVLNLFAYTGGATLAAALSGASLTHVDSVKSSIDWAAQNVAATGLKQKPIRWIQEDAMKFVLREGKRGNRYDAVILDPPRFGRGTKGEVWKIEEDLPSLLLAVKKILTAKPRFILLNAYTADLSSLAVHHALDDITKDFGGTVTSGELALQESQSKRLVPNGIFARWSSL